MSEVTHAVCSFPLPLGAVWTLTRHGARREQTCAAIKFICESDVIDDAAHTGFWMPLVDWNRYRHETYKENRDAELPYIRTSGEAAANAAPAPAAPAVSAKAANSAAVTPVFVSLGMNVFRTAKGGRDKHAK